MLEMLCKTILGATQTIGKEYKCTIYMHPLYWHDQDEELIRGKRATSLLLRRRGGEAVKVKIAEFIAMLMLALAAPAFARGQDTKT